MSANLSQTYFPVKEVPAVFQDTHLSLDFNKDTGHKFIVREDTGDILSCMTDEYKLVTNQEVMQAALPTLKEAGASLVEERMFGNGARTIWRWKFPDSIEIDKGDIVHPEVIIKNSYDGSTTVLLMSGLYRLICSNGLVIGKTINQSANRHSIYNPNLDKLPELIYELIVSTKAVITQDLHMLLNTKVESNDRVVKIIEMFPQQVMEDLVNYLSKSKIKTYWDLLNACTWVTSHAMNRSNESTFKLENTIFPTLTKWAEQAQA